MRGRYLGQVGWHKPCELEFGYAHMSQFGTVLPRQWPLVSGVDMGPPMA